MSALPFSLLGFGFLLGVKHAFEADHIAAVSTIVSSHKSIKKSSLAIKIKLMHLLASWTETLVYNRTMREKNIKAWGESEYKRLMK